MRSLVASASVLAMALAVAAIPARAQTFEGAMAGWLGSIQRWVSSIRVDTRQTSLATEQQANAGQAAAMALANVIVEQEAAISIRAAVARYESMANDEVTGLCAPAAAQESANAAAANADELADEFAQFERDWLGEGGSRIETMIATHPASAHGALHGCRSSTGAVREWRRRVRRHPGRRLGRGAVPHPPVIRLGGGRNGKPFCRYARTVADDPVSRRSRERG